MSFKLHYSYIYIKWRNTLVLDQKLKDKTEYPQIYIIHIFNIQLGKYFNRKSQSHVLQIIEIKYLRFCHMLSMLFGYVLNIFVLSYRLASLFLQCKWTFFYGNKVDNERPIPFLHIFNWFYSTSTITSWPFLLLNDVRDL